MHADFPGIVPVFDSVVNALSVSAPGRSATALRGSRRCPGSHLGLLRRLQV